MDFTFLAEADDKAVQLERAKRGLEAAKAALENAKLDYDALLAKAEDLGIPRAKLRKITEDRIQSLSDSGMLAFGPGGANSATPKSAAKPAAKPRKAKAPKEVDADADSEALSEPPVDPVSPENEMHA